MKKQICETMCINANMNQVEFMSSDDDVKTMCKNAIINHVKFMNSKSDVESVGSENDIKIMPASTQEEFTAVEQWIAAGFGGERGKCSFLRSSVFQKLRIKALYHGCEEDFTIYYNGLKIVLSQGSVMMQWIKPEVNEESCCGKHPLEIDEI